MERVANFLWRQLRARESLLNFLEDESTDVVVERTILRWLRPRTGFGDECGQCGEDDAIAEWFELRSKFVQTIALLPTLPESNPVKRLLEVAARHRSNQFVEPIFRIHREPPEETIAPWMRTLRDEQPESLFERLNDLADGFRRLRMRR